MNELPPAGWFPDPEAGGASWRWWDGYRWAPRGYGYAAAYDPAQFARALATAAEPSRNAGKWFRRVMGAHASSAFMYAIGVAIFFHGGLPSSGNGPGVDAHYIRVFVVMGPLVLLFNIVSWAYLALFIAWLFNAGRFADLEPWPARRSRTLGAFSPLIPIVNLWWPYEAICDLYPSGGRPVVALRWFVAQLVVPLLALCAVSVTTLVAPVAVVSGVVMLGGALLTIPVVLGWRLLDDLDATQRAHIASMT